MTSIQSVQVAGLQNYSQAQGVSGSRGPAPTGELPPGLKNDLAEIAEAEGLSSEQEASLESDIQDALASLFDSSDGRPDPVAVKDVISGVFEEYGLDAEQLADRLGPPGGGPPPGGATGESSDTESADETDSDSALLESLQEILDKLKDSGDAETISKISDLLVSGLLGIDVEA